MVTIDPQLPTSIDGRNQQLYRQAYSVSPWTLPAAKSMLSGSQPEQWAQSPRLQKRLKDKGWATGFIAGNVYLSSNFDLATNWSYHICENWPRAEIQIQRASKFINDYPDRDVFVVLHLMDMHLPYTEPLEYRKHFAPPRPAFFAHDQFTRTEILKRYFLNPQQVKEYVRGRYDNNLLYIDDSIQSFLKLFSAQDTVALVSDHGEEFWEHDGFEHGHTLYEELIKIPFIIHSPNLEPQKVDTRISLVDLAPTLAIDSGLETTGMTGIPLQKQAKTMMQERSIGFGRPLYGDSAWGNLFQEYKFTTRSGQEKLISLATDPKEQIPLTDLGLQNAIREKLPEAIDMPLKEGFIMTLNRAQQILDTSIRISSPNGLAKIWTGDTTIGTREIEIQEISATDFRIVWPAKQKYCVEVFILLHQPSDAQTLDIRFETEEAQEITSNPNGWRQIRWHKQHLSISKTHLPIPMTINIQHQTDDIESELKALGYQE